jgi:hypothetical protein
MAHVVLVDLLANFLRACRFRNMHFEDHDWDTTAPSATKNRRVLDIVCRSPDGLTTYAIDVRVAWNLHADGFVSYEETGSLSADGEISLRKPGFVESGVPTEPPARGAYDAGHAIRAVQCRDLRGMGTDCSALPQGGAGSR